MLASMLLGVSLAAQSPPATPQHPDGRWSENPAARADAPNLQPTTADSADIRATAAMILADLAEGSNLKNGVRGPQLRAAAQWLRNHQDPQTGRVGETSGADAGLCAYALAAAHKLSSYRIMRPVAQQAIASVVREQQQAAEPDPVATALALLAASLAEPPVPEMLRERALARVRTKPTQPEWLGIELLLQDLAPTAVRDAAEIARLAQLVARESLTEPDGTPRDELTLALATTAMYRTGGVTWQVWSRKLAKHCAEHPPAVTSNTAQALRRITLSLQVGTGLVYGKPVEAPSPTDTLQPDPAPAPQPATPGKREP